MFIVVGLGNPGKKYANTRHNVGFMVADALKLQNPNAKFQIIKPDTFMNKSGNAVRQFKDRVDELLVIHDDVDLPLGTIRIRKGGSSAGHRGVQSIIDTFREGDLSAEALAKAEDFVRVRIGIGRPPEGVETDDYVLQPFGPEQKELLSKVIDQATKLMLEYVKSGNFREKTIKANF